MPASSLKTLRCSMLTILKHLPGLDFKWTFRCALLLVFILEHDGPASYPDISEGVGIPQSKATTLADKLIAMGVVMKTINKQSLVAFVPTEKGLEMAADIAKVMQKGA